VRDHRASRPQLPAAIQLPGILRVLGVQSPPVQPRLVGHVQDAVDLPIDEDGPLPGIQQDDAPGQPV
jgi:hypothetical protein